MLYRNKLAVNCKDAGFKHLRDMLLRPKAVEAMSQLHYKIAAARKPLLKLPIEYLTRKNATLGLHSYESLSGKAGNASPLETTKTNLSQAILPEAPDKNRELRRYLRHPTLS